MVLSYLGASDSCVCYFAVMASQVEDALLTHFSPCMIPVRHFHQENSVMLY